MWLENTFGIVGWQIETMVGVAQLVELRIVIPAVVGSSPIVHPNFLKADHVICFG